MLEAFAAIVKALLYAGLLSCAGVVFAEATLRSSADIAGVATHIVRRAAALTIVASVASALILILRLGGQWDEVTLSAVFMSGSGAATCLQLAGASLLLASLSDSSSQATRLSSAALMTMSFGFTGHAAAEGLTEGLVVFVHASAAAWWIGSLWLLRHVCTRRDPIVVAGVVGRFSVIATNLIGGLVIAGLVLILILVDFPRLPSLLPYEKTLATKMAIVVAALCAASYNRFRLTPRLVMGESAAAFSLRRMIDFELILIGLVLATTSILTTYTSPA